MRRERYYTIHSCSCACTERDIKQFFSRMRRQRNSLSCACAERDIKQFFSRKRRISLLARFFYACCAFKFRTYQYRKWWTKSLHLNENLVRKYEKIFMLITNRYTGIVGTILVFKVLIIFNLKKIIN